MNELPPRMRLICEMLHHCVFSERTGNMKKPEINAHLSIFFHPDDIDAAWKYLCKDNKSTTPPSEPLSLPQEITP